METFCASNVTPSKFRSKLNANSNFYHNVTCPRSMRQIGNDYSMPTTCNRRSAPSTHNVWQDRIPSSSSRSCLERKPSRGKLCSVALAIASFLVLVAVLSIAGLALYMGALHSEPPNSFLSFSCSAKILRGDRFIGALQEKARRYQLQLESLYQRSVLGPALISCTVETFGNDTVTVNFKLVFNKRKLNNRNISSIEKTIRDILLTDAISRKPVFRNIRFDPKYVLIKQFNNEQSDKLYQRNNVITKPKEPSLALAKAGVVLKAPLRPNSTTASTTKPPVVKKQSMNTDEIDVIKEKHLPVVQGSFKISKTEADITENTKLPSTDAKKTETTTNIATTIITAANKQKSSEKPTTTSPSINTITLLIKETTSVTSALNKVATTTTTTEPSSTTTSSTIDKIDTSLNSASNTKPTAATSPLFVINHHLFDKEPWIPILPELTTTTTILPSPPLTNTLSQKQPVYTSFTNPGLSFHSLDTEQLGSTSLKSHPIPVNKIPKTTEPSVFTPKTQSSGYVEIETLQYTPGSGLDSSSNLNITNNTKYEQASVELLMKNISSIFHSLVSSLDKPTAPPINLNSTNATFDRTVDNKEELPVTSSANDSDEIIQNDLPLNKGEGYVEVVEADEASLILQQQTTKLPLVTLLPVKSNSGIGRPLRKRPYKIGDDNSTRFNLSVVENRSFPGSTKFNDLTDLAIDNPKMKFIETEVVTSISSEINKIKIDRNHVMDSYKIVGLLNFATEPITNPIGDNQSELIRNPKMEPSTVNNITLLNDNNNNNYHDNLENDSEIVVYVTNSSTSVNRGGDSTNNKTTTNFNILTPDKLKQLSEISKLHDNITVFDKEPVISTKAISSSNTVNHSGFKILTKTFHKINEFTTNNKVNSHVYNNNNMELATIINSTECVNSTVKCGDGQCLPETTKCNQLIDCNDGKDEQNCNCADYLRSQYLLRKICDGVVDCWDFSDENQCEWCNPDQYVCSNSKVCINKNKICDGLRDCPQGDDERQCVTIASNTKTADEFPYYSEGYLMVRKFGEWGKLCIENFQNVVSLSHISWKISDLGKAVCKSLTYQNLESIKNLVEVDSKSNPQSSSKYFELTYSFLNQSKSSLSFKETTCDSKEIIKVKCDTLECGARPQAVKHIARIVGGGNAGLGSWPWQAALYKEGEFQCGATLLSKRWLVSAGHCFYHSLDEHWVARLGALRRGTTLPSPYEQLRRIVRILVHPGYVDSGFINDISLLQMEFPVVFSDYVRPICLPQAGQPAIDGRLCTVVGWGQLFEVGRIFPDTLQEVQVPVISTAECRKRTVFLPLYKITDDMFCAGYERGGRDACLGDSGGPLMCPETNGRWILQGITSNGYGCARANRPGVYTKVANYVTWIRSHMSDQNSTHHLIKTVCLGHRCPLGECLPKSRLCNGYIECSDGSDERDC